MSTNSEWVLGPQGPVHPHIRYPLLRIAQLRAMEAQATNGLPAHALMERAGLALAQLTLAYAPHARTVWVACGQGNNGGDGLEAAFHLQQWGKTVYASLTDLQAPLPADAAASMERARTAGVRIQAQAPAEWDVCIDALLGIGQHSAPTGAAQTVIETLLSSDHPVIAADLPSGLLSDTGHIPGSCVRARATLSFLALKPGLFTARGRDVCGDIWLNTLGVANRPSPDGWLNAQRPPLSRPHATHKGSFGDVAIVGGASGMRGAALLAGTAALHGGAGRVYLCLLENASHDAFVSAQPALMVRDVSRLSLKNLTVVAGCGGADAVAPHMPSIIANAQHLVVDADGLNALAQTPAWHAPLAARILGNTVLTPHPLEAARLLNCSSTQVQTDRLGSAHALAQKFQCTIVLKGSGTVIASPGQLPRVNPTGNAHLATAGTGDVLAGLIGSLMAQGLRSHEAAYHACYRHGQVADQWHGDTALTASTLAEKI